MAKATKIVDRVSAAKNIANVIPPLDMHHSMMPPLIEHMRAKGVYGVDEIIAVSRVTSLSTCSNADLLSAKLDLYRAKYSTHVSDTGNVAIQAAALTERVENMRRHIRDRNTDIHARRTMLMLVDKRRKLLLYMRRKHWDMYRRIMVDFGINEEEILGWETSKAKSNTNQRIRQKYKH
jgi:small subunit ribosomal protein S15